MIKHLLADEKYGVYFPRKLSQSAAEKLAYRGNSTQSQKAMEECRLDTKDRQNVMYQRSVVAKVIEQGLVDGSPASDAEISAGTGFRAPFRQANDLPLLHWHRVALTYNYIW